MSTAYKSAVETYKALAKQTAESAQRGEKIDHGLMADKAKAFQEVRAIEREVAKEGTILAGGNNYGQTDSKRSLQQEYVRRFDSETKVEIKGETTTLREAHSKRLLGR